MSPCRAIIPSHCPPVEPLRPSVPHRWSKTHLGKAKLPSPPPAPLCPCQTPLPQGTGDPRAWLLPQWLMEAGGMKVTRRMLEASPLPEGQSRRTLQYLPQKPGWACDPMSLKDTRCKFSDYLSLSILPHKSCQEAIFCELYIPIKLTLRQPRGLLRLASGLTHE